MNKWVKQLKLAYDATELGEEASKIGSPITIEEFQYFFKKNGKVLNHHRVHDTLGIIKWQRTTMTCHICM